MHYFCTVMKMSQHQITIELATEVRGALRQKAAKKGLSPEAYLLGILKQAGPILKESSTGKGEAA